MRTLKQLAAETGVSYTQISRIETGHSTMPRFDAITRLADVLGVEPTYLIEVDEPE